MSKTPPIPPGQTVTGHSLPGPRPTITFRRELVDRFLEHATASMNGLVLDIGGKKVGKRGRFRPPLDRVDSWLYLNSDPESQPDLCCSADDIPIDSGSVDTIVCCEVLEYLEAPDRVLAEMFRVLKADSSVLLTVPFLNAIHGDHWADRQRWTPVGLVELCESAGFPNVKIRAMGSLGAVLWDLFHVALGYGANSTDVRAGGSESQSLLSRVLRKSLRLSIPFFEWLDERCVTQQKFITTGYFVELRK